jgi:hypothetical protein
VIKNSRNQLDMPATALNSSELRPDSISAFFGQHGALPKVQSRASPQRLDCGGDANPEFTPLIQVSR